MKKILTICFAILVCFTVQLFAQIPTNVQVQISKAEDELRFDKTLENLMTDRSAKIRARAALAFGRIGRETAIPTLTKLLESDSDVSVRATAAFALGEIESIKGADAILKILQDTKIVDAIRARAVEAAGKVAAANAKDEKAKSLGEAILDVLQFEDERGTRQNRTIVLLGITAVLRAKPENGDSVAGRFLTNADARIRADAANTLSRLRSKTANEKLRAMLLSDSDSVARANAARALGAAEDENAFNLLLEAAVSDEDSRVRVSAIRSLGSLKDAKAAVRLLEHGEKLLTNHRDSKYANPVEKNELLELAATFGRILPNTNDKRAITFLIALRTLDKLQSPETEIAIVRISPAEYLTETNHLPVLMDSKKIEWRNLSAVSQALGELAALPDKCFDCPRQVAESILRAFMAQKNLDSFALGAPDLLRAFASFKTDDLAEILRERLKHKDVFIRATAAELLGDTTPSNENVAALKSAFGQAVLLQKLMPDKNYNDAQLAIITALAKQDKEKKEVKFLFSEALQSPDVLVRRHTANTVKQYNLEKELPITEAVTYVNVVLPHKRKTGTKLGQVLNTNADYVRAVSRKSARAILTTEKGTFTIEFFPEDAPLTVDNFIKLARRKYFNGLAIHRVVPNFVMQDGDPRGDGNGGPGWDIRDEINMRDYERGAVGMALSGRDTGGSQWFVTHSPQPHLDGGYTVFGRVNETDMKIVDNLVRGDKILSVKIVEGHSPLKRK